MPASSLSPSENVAVPAPLPAKQQTKRKRTAKAMDGTKKSKAEPAVIQYDIVERSPTSRLSGSSLWTEPKRKFLTVSLCIPEPDEECPLTLDKITDSKLEFLPDTTFLKDNPLHTKMRLPCGHSFHAMALIYCWCKTNMLCPPPLAG